MKLPLDAIFEVPPVCTGYWNNDSWFKWWVACGSKKLPTKEEAELERQRLWCKLAGRNHYG